MKILVLGATGFVGRTVCDTFAAHGVPIVGRSRSGGWDLIDERRTIAELGEIRPDVIINCAAMVGSLNFVTEQAADVADQNLRMLVNLYRACSQVVPRATIVHPVANCGFPGDLATYREEAFWDGQVHSSVLSYGSTRRMLVVLGECYRMQHGMRSINLLVPNMYGPFDSTDPNKAHALNALISKVVKAMAIEAGRLDVWGNGIAVREWLYAPDFARLLVANIGRLDSAIFDRPLNIGQRQGWPVKELVEIVVRESGFQGEVRWDRSKPDGAPCKIMDDTRFRAAFPEFQFSSLKVGVRATVDYYRSVYPYPSTETMP